MNDFGDAEDALVGVLEHLRQGGSKVGDAVIEKMLRGSRNFVVVLRGGKVRECVAAEGARELLHQLWPQEAEEVRASDVPARLLARERSAKVHQVVPPVGAEVALHVGGRVDEGAAGGVGASVVPADIEDAGGVLHLPVEGGILVEDSAPTVVRSADQCLPSDGQEGDGEEAESAVVDQRNQRETEALDGAVEVRLHALQLVPRHLRRGRVVAAVDALRVKRELEQDASHEVLAATCHSSDVDGLDGLLGVGEIDLGNDDLAVRGGRVEEVLGETDECDVGVDLLGRGSVGLEAENLADDGLEAVVPVSHPRVVVCAVVIAVVERKHIVLPLFLGLLLLQLKVVVVALLAPRRV
mmetsp:Transcript_10105/g.41175  ORF Transcript_10105/g.41175 Transcript_10105/m.41175 type:complete len:354 (+) Transcript_10105:271-1332(+)